MRFFTALGLATFVAGSLTACNEGSTGGTTNTSTAPGTLIQSPPFRVASLNATDLAKKLGATASGQQLLAVSTPNPALNLPTCGVDVHYFQYQTVGGKGEATTASGALMVPTGAAACTNGRPVLLHAHGTAVSKIYNMANILDTTNPAWTESAMVAAFFAAHGWIVIAPNFAGIDSSPLPYSPYLNADAQSKDMINAYTAAMAAVKAGLPSGITASTRLFVSGYSAGGHTAMATHRAMEAANIAVTGAAPLSGAYALLAFGDAAVTYSSPSVGSTIYYPYIINSYQQSYGNLYTNGPADVFSANYASGIDTLFPGAYDLNTIVSSGKVPQFALFNSTTPGQGTEPSTGIPALDAAMAVPNPATNPVGALGFGSPYLINNSVRIAYALDSAANPDGVVPSLTTGLPAAAPLHPLRKGLKLNDLRGWAPKAPVMLCGGHDDPEVFYSLNTTVMAGEWASLIGTGQVNVVDVDPGSPQSAGGLPTDMATIAAMAYGADLLGGVTSATQLGADVQAAIVSAAQFSAYFTGGVPNLPQGVEVAGLASVAGQAVTQYYIANPATTPTAMGTNVANAVTAYFHFPFTQLSCEVAAQAYFAQIP